MSDGTATLHFLDPQSYKEIRQVEVTAGGMPVMQLNELEMVEGELWANIWQTDRIARIDLSNGHVVGWVDLSGLLSADDRREQVDVLNGIAYDAGGKRLFVTGKLWPRLFQIELVPPTAEPSGGFP
jgi:glutamine cyclotransferase